MQCSGELPTRGRNSRCRARQVSLLVPEEWSERGVEETRSRQQWQVWLTLTPSRTPLAWTRAVSAQEPISPGSCGMASRRGHQALRGAGWEPLLPEQKLRQCCRTGRGRWDPHGPWLHGQLVLPAFLTLLVLTPCPLPAKGQAQELPPL